MLFSLLICAESLFSHEGDSFAAWKEFSTGKDSSLLISWLKKNARCIITGHRFSEKPGVEIPQFYGRYGIFITLKNSKGVRGCYGSFYPHTPDARMLLSDYLEGALTRDPRHEPVDISELDATDIILTVASHPVPVEDIYSVDLSENGIMIKTAGRSIIYVPEEIKSIDYILNMLPNAQREFYAFRAVTIKGETK